MNMFKSISCLIALITNSLCDTNIRKYLFIYIFIMSEAAKLGGCKLKGSEPLELREDSINYVVKLHYLYFVMCSRWAGRQLWVSYMIFKMHDIYISSLYSVVVMDEGNIAAEAGVEDGVSYVEKNNTGTIIAKQLIALKDLEPVQATEKSITLICI